MSQAEEIRGRRIVPVEQVPPGQRDMVTNCFYCSCPKHPKKRKAVAAIAVEGLNQFYGICGYHAEAPHVMPHLFSTIERGLGYL